MSWLIMTVLLVYCGLMVSINATRRYMGGDWKMDDWGTGDHDQTRVFWKQTCSYVSASIILLYILFYGVPRLIFYFSEDLTSTQRLIRFIFAGITILSSYLVLIVVIYVCLNRRDRRQAEAETGLPKGEREKSRLERYRRNKRVKHLLVWSTIAVITLSVAFTIHFQSFDADEEGSTDLIEQFDRVVVIIAVLLLIMLRSNWRYDETLGDDDGGGKGGSTGPVGDALNGRVSTLVQVLSGITVLMIFWILSLLLYFDPFYKDRYTLWDFLVPTFLAVWVYFTYIVCIFYSRLARVIDAKKVWMTIGRWKCLTVVLSLAVILVFVALNVLFLDLFPLSDLVAPVIMLVFISIFVVNMIRWRGDVTGGVAGGGGKDSGSGRCMQIFRLWIVVMIAVFVAVPTLVYAYLSWTGNFYTSGFFINSGFPTLNFKRGPVSHVAFFLLMFLFPLFYLVGVGIERALLRVVYPPLDTPVALERDKSIFVIADTHMGLRPNVFLELLEMGADWDQRAIESFSDWLLNITRRPPGFDAQEALSVDIWENDASGEGRMVPKTLCSPKYMVLLGDILEWWDGWQESVQLAMTTTLSKFNRMGSDSEVVYLVGNHDNIHQRDRTPDLRTHASRKRAMKKARRLVPEKEITLVPDIWPGPEDPWGMKMRPIEAGDSRYLFVHGHQFGLWYQFLGSFAYIPGLLRRAAQLGYYTWLLFMAILGLVWFMVVVDEQNLDTLAIMVIMVLVFFLAPTIYMTMARIVYNLREGPRYDNRSGLGNFYRWWLRTAGGGPTPEEGVKTKVVYGHTHVTDCIKVVREFDKASLVWEEPYDPGKVVCELLNIPAWTKDYSRPMERGVFLYIDGQGHLFLGWNWTDDKAFHIPDELVIGKATDWNNWPKSKIAVWRQRANDLGWPKPFVEMWFNEWDWRRRC